MRILLLLILAACGDINGDVNVGKPTDTATTTDSATVAAAPATSTATSTDSETVATTSVTSAAAATQTATEEEDVEVVESTTVSSTIVSSSTEVVTTTTSTPKVVQISNGMTKAEIKAALGDPLRVVDNVLGYFWVYEDDYNQPKFCYARYAGHRNTCKVEFSGNLMVGQDDFLAKWLDIMALDLAE